MPDFKKFLKGLGIGDKQTFSSSNTTVRFDKESKSVQKPSFHSEEPDIEDLKQTATRSLSSNTTQKPFFSRLAEVLQKGQDASIKAFAKAQQRFQSGSDSPQRIEPSLAKYTSSKEDTQQPIFSTIRTVSPEKIGNVNLPDIPSKLHLSDPALKPEAKIPETYNSKQEQTFELTEKNSVTKRTPAQQETAIIPGQNQEAQFENIWGRFADGIDQRETQANPTEKLSKRDAIVARVRAFAKENTEALKAHEAANPDMIPDDEKHSFEGTLHEADPSSILNHPEPEELKRPKGKGTKYTGGAHVETIPGHTADNPDKSLNDAWSAYARNEMKKDTLRESEQARKEEAYLDEVEAEQMEQDAPER